MRSAQSNAIDHDERRTQRRLAECPSFVPMQIGRFRGRDQSISFILAVFWQAVKVNCWRRHKAARRVSSRLELTTKASGHHRRRNKWSWKAKVRESRELQAAPGAQQVTKSSAPLGNCVLRCAMRSAKPALIIVAWWRAEPSRAVRQHLSHGRHLHAPVWSSGDTLASWAQVKSPCGVAEAAAGFEP